MTRHSTTGILPLLVAASLLLTACSDDTDHETGPSPSASTSSGPDDAGSDGRQHLAGDSFPLGPGTYQFSFASNPVAETPDALVDVPSGFDDEAEWYVVSHDGDAFLGMYTVGQVQRDACHRPNHGGFTPGPSVEDLADALTAQKSTRASTPKPVTLAGYHGLYVELTSPRDLSKCAKGPSLWGGRGIYGDGQVDRVWILDVDGQRLVVDAAYGPTSTGPERDKLTSMVESARFIEP